MFLLPYKDCALFAGVSRKRTAWTLITTPLTTLCLSSLPQTTPGQGLNLKNGRQESMPHLRWHIQERPDERADTETSSFALLWQEGQKNLTRAG